jgi:hypothetical protein
LWRLDRTNLQGEALTDGDRNLIAYLVICNGKPLSPSETASFYNELRERDLGWKWFRENNIGWLEIVDALQSLREGKQPNDKVIACLSNQGLVSPMNTVSSIGMSLLVNQTASERKTVQFGDNCV